MEDVDFEDLFEAIMSQRYKVTVRQPTVIKIGPQSWSFGMHLDYMNDEDGDIDIAMVADFVAHQLRYKGMKHEELEEAVLFLLREVLPAEERQLVRGQLDFVEKEKKIIQIKTHRYDNNTNQ